MHEYLILDLDLRVEIEEDTSLIHTQQIAELQDNFTVLNNRLGTVEGTVHGVHHILIISDRLISCQETYITCVFNFRISFLVDMGNFSFLATVSNYTLSMVNGEAIVFDEVRINEGNNYNPTTGVYTGKSSRTDRIQV